MRLNLIIIGLIVALSSCNQKQETLTPEQAKQIAKEAYIYGLPMVLNYKTIEIPVCLG